MEMDSDTGLLIVDFDHGVSTEGTHLGKGSCVYTTTLSTENCHEIQIATPLQCLTELNQSLCRIEQDQITQIQPIHYEQIQVGYEGSVGNEGISSLYHNVALNSFSPSYSSSFLQSLSSPAQVAPAEELTPPPPPPPPPPMPKTRKKTPPPDPNNVPRFPINEYEYYKEIEELLAHDKYPEGVSENYKAHLKKRAQHYQIIKNELYHNQKKPKKVIMRKEEQNRLLEFSHILSLNGIHLGIKKMVDSIGDNYFWRGLYEDVANFVNSCPQCRDNVDLAQQKEKETRSNEESEDNPGLSTAVSAMQTSSIVWTMVEIQVHGPFKLTASRNEFVVTITDPESCFLQAAALPRSGRSTKVAEFILKTFYTFGFPKCFFIGDKDMYDEVSTEFDLRLKQTAWKTKLSSKENSKCTWVSQLIELLIMRKGERWDKEMDKFMFQFRAGTIRGAYYPADLTPFYSMFQRAPYHEDKENFDFRKMSKKKMHKNPLQCEHCDEIFTSKVTFRLHNKRHKLEEERNDTFRKLNESDGNSSDTLDPATIGVDVGYAMDELKNFLAKTKESRRKRGKYQKYSVELQERMISYALKHGAVKASSYFSQLTGTNINDSTIRNLLKSSVNFQPRVKEDIARFAVEFGLEKASKHFSEKLKKDVPLSLVKKFKAIYGNKFKKKDETELANARVKKRSARNIRNLDDKEKDDIGDYARNHSLQETIQHFLEKMNVALNENDVENCRRLYVEKSTNAQLIEIQESNRPNMPLLEIEENNRSNTQLLEIQENSRSDTQLIEVQESSSDLQTISYQTINLNEGNVCFSPTGSFVQIVDGTYSYQSISFQTEPNQADTSVQEQSNTNSELQNNFIIVSQEDAAPYEISVQTEENSQRSIDSWRKSFHLQESQGSEGFAVELSTASQKEPGDPMDFVELPTESQKESEESLEFVELSSESQKEPEEPLSFPELPTESQKEPEEPLSFPELPTESQKEPGESSSFIELPTECQNKPQESTSSPELPSESQKEPEEPSGFVELPIESQKEPEDPLIVDPPVKEKNKGKKKEGTKKRGSYMSYSPELRAKIGKYAAENGSFKASVHFSKFLGHDLPQSTARGLKEKYLSKMRHCDVTSLGYSPRGRPLRLGKYDEVVQECLKELVRSGERLTSFLAITTAKQILNKLEPGLLQENGGSVILNNTWAKSFLKRIGVRNNS